MAESQQKTIYVDKALKKKLGHGGIKVSTNGKGTPALSFLSC